MSDETKKTFGEKLDEAWYDPLAKRWKDMRDSQGQSVEKEEGMIAKHTGGKGEKSEGMIAKHTGKKEKDYSIASNPYKYGTAAIAAGLGALALAKKMRDKKKKAAKKSTKA